MTTTSTRTRRAPPVADALGRNYAVMTPPERFTLLVEAWARTDEAEADRLDGTCRKLTYAHNDAECRDRVQGAYLLVLLATANLQKLLAVIRCSGVLVDCHRE